MKKLFTIILLIPLLITSNTGAQTGKYYPFPDSNALWNIHFVIFGIPGIYEEFYSINITGDTTINGKGYHKLFTPFVQSSGKTPGTSNQPGYQGAIRQDTVIRTVYFVPPTDTAEQLLYDFTLQAGDTVYGYLQPEGGIKDVVSSIDSVMVGNEYRKRWNINDLYSISLIEGVGSTYGLIEKSPGNVADMPGYGITCFSQNGETLYPDTITDCGVITSVELPIVSEEQIQIYPNPSNGTVYVEFDRSLVIKYVKISDLAGRAVLQQERVFGNPMKFDLMPGVFLLTLTDQANRSLTRKIVIYGDK